MPADRHFVRRSAHRSYRRSVHLDFKGCPQRLIRRICSPLLLVVPAGLALAGMKPAAAQVFASQPPAAPVAAPDTGPDAQALFGAPRGQHLHRQGDLPAGQMRQDGSYARRLGRRWRS
jgi:hypothetical protein